MARIDELLQGPDRDVIVAEMDRRVTAGIKGYSFTHPVAADLPKRLQEIEARVAEKDDELKRERLSHFAYRECTKAKLDPTMLDGFALTDEAAITAKVLQLGKIASAADLRARQDLMGSSFKPGCGVDICGAPARNDPVSEFRAALSPNDRAALEKHNSRR